LALPLPPPAEPDVGVCFAAGLEVASGSGLVEGMWLTDWMLAAARWVHTTGFALPVAAKALTETTLMTATTVSAGTSRSARRAGADTVR
jgi:hypothetical protein